MKQKQVAKLENFKNIMGGKIRNFEKYGGKIEKYIGKIGDKIGKFKKRYWQNWKN